MPSQFHAIFIDDLFCSLQSLTKSNSRRFHTLLTSYKLVENISDPVPLMNTIELRTRSIHPTQSPGLTSHSSTRSPHKRELHLEYDQQQQQQLEVWRQQLQLLQQLQHLPTSKMAAGNVSLLPKFNVGMEPYPEFLRKKYRYTHTRQGKRKIQGTLP